MTYSVAFARSGVDGEVQWDAVRNSWKRSESPATELVVIALQCQRGTCPVDPGLGVDWSSVDKLRTDARTRAEDAIRSGLKRYVDSGAIADLRVSAEVYPARGMIAFDVSFVDVLLGAQTRQRVRGER